MPKYDLAHISIALSKEEKGRINGLSLEERFREYLALNRRLYADAQGKQRPVLLERFWPGTISAHNVFMGKRLEEEVDVYKEISSMRPDHILLVTVSEEAIKRRMKARPPQHKYESDVATLVTMQEELKRVVDLTHKRMDVPYTIIDNSTDHFADLESSLNAVKI